MTTNGAIGLGDCAAIPVGARHNRLAFEFPNFRLDPEVRRTFSLGYRSSLGRSDITDWPAEFASVQITTEEQMHQIESQNSETFSRRPREWMLTWRKILGA